MTTMFFESAYSWSPPASAISCSTFMSPISGYGPGFVDLAGDVHLAAVDLLHDDGGVRLRDELRRRLLELRSQLIGRQPAA